MDDDFGRFECVGAQKGKKIESLTVGGERFWSRGRGRGGEAVWWWWYARSLGWLARSVSRPGSAVLYGHCAAVKSHVGCSCHGSFQVWLY
jgi:hypothetical protein